MFCLLPVSSAFVSVSIAKLRVLIGVPNISKSVAQVFVKTVWLDRSYLYIPRQQFQLPILITILITS